MKITIKLHHQPVSLTGLFASIKIRGDDIRVGDVILLDGKQREVKSVVQEGAFARVHVTGTKRVGRVPANYSLTVARAI